MKKFTAVLTAVILLFNCIPSITLAAPALSLELIGGVNDTSLGVNDFAIAGGKILFKKPVVPSGYTCRIFNNGNVIDTADITAGPVEDTIALTVKSGENNYSARLFDTSNRRVAASDTVYVFGYTYAASGDPVSLSNTFKNQMPTSHIANGITYNFTTYKTYITQYLAALDSGTVTDSQIENYKLAKNILQYDETTGTYGKDPKFIKSNQPSDLESSFTSASINYMNEMVAVKFSVFLDEPVKVSTYLFGYDITAGNATTAQRVVKSYADGMYIDTDQRFYINHQPTALVMETDKWYDLAYYFDTETASVDFYANGALIAKDVQMEFNDGYTSIKSRYIKISIPYMEDTKKNTRQYVYCTLPEINNTYTRTSSGGDHTEGGTDGTPDIGGDDTEDPDINDGEVPPPAGDYVSRFPFDHEFTVKDGLLVVEAEDLAIVNPSDKLYVANNSRASGGKMLYWKYGYTGTDPSKDANALPEFKLTAYIDKPGAYNVWIRYGQAGTANNAGVGWFTSLNGGSTWSKVSPGGMGNQAFKWRPIRSLKLKEGRIDMLFSHFYSQGCFDKIIITDNLAWTPTDKDSVPDGSMTEWYDEAKFNGEKVIPPAGHPRLFVRKDNVSNLWSAIQNEPEMKRYYEMLTHQYTLEYLPRLYNSQNANVDSVRLGIKARSLVYVLNDTATMQRGLIGGSKTNRDEYGRDTIEWTKIWAHNLTWSSTSATAHRAIGAAMCSVAIMYDWHYDLLTEDEKQFFIGKLTEWATLLEFGYPSQIGGNIYGHQHEYQNYRDLLQAGAAIYDEFPEMWNTTAGRVFGTSFKARGFLAQSGNHNAGSSYGAGIRSESEFLAAMLLQGFGYSYKDTFGEGFARMPLRFIYSRLPYGRLLNEGEHSPERTIGYDGLSHLIGFGQFMFADTEYATLYHNKWLENLGLVNLTSRSPAYAFDLLMARNLYTGDLDDLKGEFDLGKSMPLSHFTTYPITQMYARTSWQMGLEAPVAMVYVQGREKSLDAHLKPDVGSFQIYYKGDLTNQSTGRFLTGDSGSGPWNSSLDRNYTRRTVAHNCMTVYDPEEVMFSSYRFFDDKLHICSNDGGLNLDKWWLETRFANFAGVDTDYALENYGTVAKTESTYLGPNKTTPEFTLLKTDLTESYGGRRVRKSDGKLLTDCIKEEFTVYNSAGKAVTDPEQKLKVNNRVKASDVGNASERGFIDFLSDFELVPKLSDYKRYSVFVDLNNEDYPAAFIVYDKIDSTDASFEKNWLLHANSEPVVNGNVTTITRTDNGCNGKLVVNTLLPANPDIELIGGIDKACWVDGVNYGKAPSGTFPEDTSGGGTGEEDDSQGSTDGEEETSASDVQFPLSGWRIEVSPGTQAKEDLFLNAMYVTDADRNLPALPMNKFEDDNFVGVTVLDRFVAFAKSGKTTDAGFTITIPDNNNGGQMSNLITDVAPGLWSVKKSTESAARYFEVAEGENTLYFKGNPGVYTIAPVTSGTATQITYPEMEKSQIGDFQIYTAATNGGAKSLRYQKYPTKLINGKPYVCVEDFFPAHKATVTVSGNSATITSDFGSYTCVVTVGSTSTTQNGTKKTVTCRPVLVNGKIYVNPTELTNGLNMTLEYRDLYKTLVVTMKAS